MRRTFLATTVALSLVVSQGVASTALAAPTSLKSEKAQELRAAARAKADEQRGGDADLAGDTLFDSGKELGDPELMLDAVEVRKELAAEARDKAKAQQGIDEALVALDIIHYYEDGASYEASSWRPVESGALGGLHGKADGLVSDLESLIEEIEEEERAAAKGANKAAVSGDGEEKKKKKRKKGSAKPGTGLIAGGAVALVFGAGGAGLMGAGLAIGGSKQKEAEGLDLPTQNDELAQLDREGANANIMAYVGGAVAAVGVGVGIGLIVVGVKKRKGGGKQKKDKDTASVMVFPTLDGLAITGRF